MRLKLDKDLKILLAVVLIIFVVNIFLIHPTFSDENFYFNVAKAVSEGKTPYKDFFLSHPPLQTYALALLFKIFGSSFLVAKLLSIAASAGCVIFVFLIGRQLFDKKSAWLAVTFFLANPIFLAFSSMGYGVWEAMLLVLASIYLLISEKVKHRYFAAGIFFAAAVFFRYIALLYLPLTILILVMHKKTKITGFITTFVAATLPAFIMLYALFGQTYFDQTVAYHLVFKTQKTLQINQYWAFGYFLLFLVALSVFVAYIEKNKLLLLFAVVPLAIDIFILLVFKFAFYHYFLISLPFYCLAAARAFVVSKYKIVKLIIPAIFVLMLVYNLSTLDFYLNPQQSEKFYRVVSFVGNMLAETENKNLKIFGEPVMTNYVSFVSGVGVAGNYFDTYLDHLVWEGERSVIEKIAADKPAVFIDMQLYGAYFRLNPEFSAYLQNYKLTMEVEGLPRYFVYIPG